LISRNKFSRALSDGSKLADSAQRLGGWTPLQRAKNSELLFRTHSAFSTDDGGLQMILAVLDNL
jgi:hypothetical protein